MFEKIKQIFSTPIDITLNRLIVIAAIVFGGWYLSSNTEIAVSILEYLNTVKDTVAVQAVDTTQVVIDTTAVDSVR